MAALPDPLAPPSAAIVAAEEALLRTAGMDVERHEMVANGTRLHYLTCGEGEPLVLLHGRGSAAARFTPVLGRLAQKRRVIALDLPGWGLSGKPAFTGKTAEDALTVWSDGVLALLDEQKIEQADLLGHSMGGFVALGLALAQPERVQRLILVDAAGLGTQIQLDARLFFALGPEKVHRRLGRRFTRFLYAQEQQGGKRRLPGAEKPPLDGPDFDFFRAVMTEEAVIASGAKAFGAWVNLRGVHLSLADRLKELELPVLMIWGNHDALTPYPAALAASRTLRDGKLVTFLGCGHAPFAERPQDFAYVVLTWLDGIYVRSRA
ncbi:MAG: hypothetical protein OJF49_003522 [Ktedonobacterales bacterium]|jgi:pimeloyl-ACP methyl ester carboxylesterase|nr:MAG: hypothetical protein OJF49_003522 [Ktedonobacterales bacterium]